MLKTALQACVKGVLIMSDIAFMNIAIMSSNPLAVLLFKGLIELSISIPLDGKRNCGLEEKNET